MPLGQGEYRCFIADRGGSPLRSELLWESLNFGRRVDEVSSATVTCGSAPPYVRAWQHELVIFRNDELAWCGPVSPPTWDANQDTPNVTIQAPDLFGWFDVRCLERDRSWTQEDLSAPFEQAAADALERDPSPNIEFSTSTTGVKGDRKIVGAQFGKAGDFLRELARSGLDFTMFGRQLICGGPEIPRIPAFVLTDDTLLSPKVQGGQETGSEAIVIGANSGTQQVPIVGRAGGVDADIGLVQRVFTESTILDQNSAEAAAQTHRQHLATEPLYVSGVLHPRLLVEYNDLIAGRQAHVYVTAEGKVVDAMLRLQQLTTTVQRSDQGQQEEHAVTLIPLGTE